MMLCRVTIEGRITSSSGELTKDVADALATAMAEMHELKTKDPGITLDIPNGGAVVMSCCVEVEDAAEAVPPASTNIRTGLCAAGIATPNWPMPDDPRWQVEFVTFKTDVLVPA